MENLEQKLQVAKDDTLLFLNQYASSEACKDLIQKVDIELLDYFGEERTIFRDKKTGQILATKQGLVEHLKKSVSFYFTNFTNSADSKQDQKQGAKKSFTKANEVDAEITKAVADGNMELFRELRKKQGGKMK